MFVGGSWTQQLSIGPIVADLRSCVASKRPSQPLFAALQSLARRRARMFNTCQYNQRLMARITDRAGRTQRSALQQAAPLPAAALRRSNLGQPQHQSIIGDHHVSSSRHGKAHTALVDPCVRSKRPSKRPSSRNESMPLAIPRHAYKRHSPHAFYHNLKSHTITNTHTIIMAPPLSCC
jgi:hypothetical protein